MIAFDQLVTCRHEIPSAPFQTEICPAIWTRLHMVVPTFVIHGRLEVVESYVMGKIAGEGDVPDPKIQKTFIVTKARFGWLDR